MAIVYLAGNRITGLSSDTKPTLVPANSQFTETDTKRVFHYNGTNWFILRGGYNAKKDIFYKIGSTYYYERYDGTVIDSSTTCETVLQSAVNSGGILAVTNGVYDFSAGFTGITFSSNKTLELDPNAQFSVPQGYTSALFNIPNGIKNVNIRGGYFFEAGTPAKLWTGIKLEATTSAGIIHCSFREMKIEDARIGIHLKATVGTGTFLNACLFEQIWINRPIIGVLFESDYPSPGHGINRNLFNQVWVQNDIVLDDCTHGFKDIQNVDNTFIACKVWDQPSPVTAKTATIAPNALHTTIIGGIMARDSDFYIDNSWPRSTVLINGDYSTSPIVVGELSLNTSSMVSNGKRTGGWTCFGATSGWGIFSPAFTAYSGTTGTSQVITYANGTAGRTIPTGTTAGNPGGYKFINPFTCRGWNPRYRAKVLFNTNTLQRIYFGFSGITAGSPPDLAGDDPLNALPGVLIGARSADTNFQVMHNDSTGATNFINTGVPINTTSIRTFDIKASETSTTNKWKWSIDGSAWPDITGSNIPSQTEPLGIHFALINNQATVVKSMTVFEVMAETQ